VTNQIIHFPDMYHKRQIQQVIAADAAVREIADLVSLKRFNVPALALSVERRELVIGFLEELWTELDQMAAQNVTKGRAS
jgi:hypothetical protein